MGCFVFRNDTVERFFGKDYYFSGYGDISVIPPEAEFYVWFYQQPLRYDRELVAAEIEGYAQNLRYLLSQIRTTKMVVALTMERLCDMPLTDDDRRLRSAVIAYNESLVAMEEQFANLKVIDFSDFCRRYTDQELIDWKYYFLAQIGLNPKLSKDFKLWFSRKLEGISLKRKKCLVLDLDNTLWGGVLGEVGIEGVLVGGDYPGKAFQYFQQSLLELSKSGVVLTVCSKNNEKDVLEVWEKNPFLVLRKEHFTAWRINWGDKATNIKELADELNIGLDSFVFVDDSPLEREFVKEHLPMVEVPEFPVQPYELPLFFQQLVEKYFRTYSITSEDKKKTEQYRAHAQRTHAQRTFTDMKAFLKGLDMRIMIETANEINIPRIAQLTQKTNQFNLTTQRYTDADIRSFLQKGWKVWCMSTADKYGDDGMTGCVIVRPNGNDNLNEMVEIDTFLLSCRVLGRGIENAFLKTVLAQMRSKGIEVVKATYVPTMKNSQVADFYEKNGFTVYSEDPSGTKHYVLNLHHTDLSVEEYYHIIIK